MEFFRKNSGYIGFGLLLFGMIVGAIGWNRNESTIPARTHGAVFMIVLGVVMIVGGLVTLAANSSKEK